MSKKDYIKFAAMIKAYTNEQQGQLIQTVSIVQIAKDLAVICEDDNPNFNRERFLKACGVIK